MKILFIYYRDIHLEDAGASRTIIERMNYLSAQPNVEVYTSMRILYGASPKIIQLPVEKLDVESIRRIVIERNIDILEALIFFDNIGMANKVVEGTNCRVVTEFHSSPGYEVMNLMTGIKDSCNVSLRYRLLAAAKLALFPLYKFYVKRKSRIGFQNASLKTDKLVVLVESFIEEYKQAYNIPKANNIAAIGNPLSFLTTITPEQIDQKEKTVLIVSRFDERHKRISLAIKVWAKIEAKYPDWKMQIVGKGESKQYYEELILKLKLKRVSLCGWQSPEEYYTKASIFLMTSAYEGWGMTLTEALQKGCVPVAMNSFSALPNIVNNSVDGFITPNNDLPAFVEKVELLIKHPELRKQMALNGVSSCQRFSIDVIGQQWIKLYNEVLNS